jgi:hypothetical protein
MGPGDVLYLPPGVVHHTEAIESDSIALLVTFLPVSFRRLVDLLLDRVFMANPRWRGLPVWVGDDGGRLPAHAEAFAAARIGEISALLGAISPSGVELGEIWRRLPVSADAWTPRRAAGTIHPETRLAVCRRAPLAVVAGRDAGGQEGVRLFRGQRELAVDGAWAGLFQQAVAADRFTAKEALAWAPPDQRDDWEGVRSCLTALVEEGFVEIVGGDGQGAP